MKKPLIVLLHLTISINLFASTTEEECSNQLQTYGSGVTKEQIATDCYSVFKKSISQNAIHTSDDLNIEVLGKRNAFYIKNTELNTEELLSGVQSTLVDIRAISYSKLNKEVYVLENNSAEVKIFSSLVTGNIAPLRVIRTEQLMGAVDLTVHKDNVYVLNGTDHSVLVYSRLANYYGREGFQRLNLLNTYEGLPESSHSISIKDNNLVVHFNKNTETKVISIK
jgi:hypothetical protein